MTREERAWRSLFGGKTAPKPTPNPAPYHYTEPALLHPERLTDPRYQMRPWRKGGKIEYYRRNGWLNQARIDAHYALVNLQNRSLSVTDLPKSAS